ncbi:hypothetical protein A3L09_09655 [Thermococcus profundus]|uniref:DUF835 domain-containing protein n=1 Tax=Thermococcus profundus TaxID=49899 RepID=A0A2Z2MN24_THEPR|nr:hypothetical protein A3L09_09655 [Thermococcus profundus]
MLGAVAGVIALLISLVFTISAYLYYQRLTTPASKGLAFRILLSSLFSVAGSLGVIIDSLSPKPLWWIMASMFLTSYLIIMTAALHYLKLSVQLFGREASQSPFEKKPGKGAVVGGFSISSDDLSKIAPLCKLVNGVVYVGRKQKPVGCSKADKTIWLSRVDAPNATDPAKLHVIMEHIMRFVSEKGGNCLIILDGLEYLLLHNDFKGVMKFLASLKDYVLLSNSLLVVVIDEETLGRREFSVLRREFPELEVEGLLSRAEERALFGALSKETLEAEEEEKPEGDS